MRDIIIDFSGWVRMAPEDVKFLSVHTGPGEADVIIDGIAWQQLSVAEQSDYVIESIVDCQLNCTDGPWYDNIDYSVDTWQDIVAE